MPTPRGCARPTVLDVLEESLICRTVPSRVRPGDLKCVDLPHSAQLVPEGREVPGVQGLKPPPQARPAGKRLLGPTLPVPGLHGYVRETPQLSGSSSHLARRCCGSSWGECSTPRQMPLLGMIRSGAATSSWDRITDSAQLMIVLRPACPVLGSLAAVQEQTRPPRQERPSLG